MGLILDVFCHFELSIYGFSSLLQNVETMANNVVFNVIVSSPHTIILLILYNEQAYQAAKLLELTIYIEIY